MGSIPTPGTMSMRTFIRSIQRRLDPYAPLIEVEISRSALIHNLHTYQKQYPKLSFAPVLKSNAYGHGLALVARILEREDIPFLMVDSLYEVRQLRLAGIRARILVMGYVRPRDMVRARLKNVDFALTDYEQLVEVARRARRPLRVHIKLDTGMHRQGIAQSDLPSALNALMGTPAVSVVGVCSHFGDADGDDETHTRSQVAAWKELSGKVLSAFPMIEFRHIAATKGVRFAEEAGTNVVRLGIGLYGIDTSPFNTLTLRPALSMRSLVASIRTVPKGDWIGYNATYTAQTDRLVATVPAGYYEGVDRGLSNTGAMEVKKVVCPIVGRVSMNMSSIDVTEAPGVRIGDSVTVISRVPGAANSVTEMAGRARTTPYVLLARIPQHLRRTVDT